MKFKLINKLYKKIMSAIRPVYYGTTIDDSFKSDNKIIPIIKRNVLYKVDDSIDYLVTCQLNEKMNVTLLHDSVQGKSFEINESLLEYILQKDISFEVVSQEGNALIIKVYNLSDFHVEPAESFYISLEFFQELVLDYELAKL